nr:cytochrome c peroxidase [Hyphomicrobium methylovorum]
MAAVLSASVLASFAISAFSQSAVVPNLDALEALGGQLFSDRDLSFSRKQNCVSCHSPQLAFSDPRSLGEINGAVSRGGDGRSFGDRNAPTLMYIAFTPAFHRAAGGAAIGGMFWDGRASTLKDQIRDPLLNPVEMAMPDEESVVQRLREKPEYQEAFASLFGPEVLSDTPRAFAAAEEAMAAFLRTRDFAPFDSKYDRSLRGEVVLSAAESKGRDIFFADGRCSACHMTSESSGSKAELFTNFRYYNLGVPKNDTVRRLNGSKPDRIDHGLLENAAIDDPAQSGRFKVPTLRNVAVTGPYMHNGLFQELRTAVLFHQRFSPHNSEAQINPETGRNWDTPEVADNVARAELQASPLSSQDVDNLIAFLKSLTDRTYEDLLR